MEYADARVMLKEALTRKAKLQRDREQLHKMVGPMARRIPYKTKGAKGWDVMVDAMMSDTHSGPAK
jgi:hypothetical protein